MQNIMQVVQSRKEVQEEIKRLQRIETSVLKHCKGAPKGHLRCKKRGKGFQYYMGNTYLGREKKPLIKEIANREYIDKLIPLIREKIVHLKRLDRDLGFDYYKPEQLYEMLHPARKCLVQPILISTERYIEQWMATPYERWEITDEEIRGTFVTEKGERVRSKSEKIIADALNHYGVPYRYEYPLKRTCGTKTVVRRPDFMVLSRTLEEKIIEHLGMMGDELYYQKNMEKIDLYEKNGYLIGKNLILLHETADSPLDTTVMEQYISEFLL